MKLSSVYSARTAWILDTDELNPFGRRLFPAFAAELARHFEFMSFPQSPEQFDLDAKTGVRFDGGGFNTSEGPVEARFEIHRAGIAVETRHSTAISEEILRQIAQWSVKEFGVNFDQSRIRNNIYVSQLVFYVDKDISKGLAALNAFSEILSNVRMNGRAHHREPVALLFRGESEDRYAFSFERRKDAPFSENKYYSSCDVPTDVHISLIEQLETILAEG